jgi:hypothetical protein
MDGLNKEKNGALAIGHTLNRVTQLLLYIHGTVLCRAVLLDNINVNNVLSFVCFCLVEALLSNENEHRAIWP